MDEELDVTKLKYVLYARKSTDDPQRQARSIPDQIHDCEVLINRLKLNVVNSVQETRSAKKPNQRPQFTQILRDLRSGKYDGIIAWHPDRLARNMKEGGEVIDMIDEGYIKDLKFVTHHFSNDPNGKMLLGMSFVLSKQYSDDLSQKVTRGVRGNLSEGKSSGTPKHGYIRNDQGLYTPDGKNFELIKEAWQMRTAGTSLDLIAKFLDESGYARITKGKKREVILNDKTLSVVFRDPFYYGVLVQTNQNVDLREIYDFEPAVSEEDYWVVQSLTQRRIAPNKPHRAVFYPLKTMVICNFCNHNMYIGPVSGRTQRYLTARCGTEGCQRVKKSIRMKVIFEFIYKFLEEGLNFTEKDYKEYYGGVINESGEQRERNKIELHRNQGLLSKVTSEVKRISLRLVESELSETVVKISEERIIELKTEQKRLSYGIEHLQSIISKPEEDALSIEEFLNLSKNAAIVVKAADAVVKDAICRIIFLNLKVDEEKVLSYQLKEPFATLLKTHNSVSGRGDRT